MIDSIKNLIPHFVKKWLIFRILKEVYLYGSYWLDNKIYWLTHLKTPLFEHVLIQTNFRCTRKCTFCLYGMKDIQVDDVEMPDWLFEKIINELSDINYSGRISLFEMNEPLTEERIVDMVRYVREKVPRSWQLIVSNGDLLTKEKAISLIRAGLDYLKISSYSPSNYKKIKAILNELPEDVKSHVGLSDSFDQDFAHDNRGGNLPHIQDIQEPLKESCRRINHILYIKPDGTVTSCFGDYFNKNIVGDAKEQKVAEVWFGNIFKELRKNLRKGNRKISELCSKCNISGKNDYFFTKQSIKNIQKNTYLLNGAIVGASVSARTFYPYLKKYSRIMYMVSKSGDIDNLYVEDNLIITDDYQMVLSDPRIDYIFISNQNKFHFTTARQALIAGKHVLVEKPITLSIEHLDELIKESNGRQLVLGGIFQWRFMKVVKIMKEYLSNNTFGKLLFVNGRVLWHRTDSYFSHGRGTWDIDGGGVLIKQAIHCLDLLFYLAGNPISWNAYGSNRIGKRETEDTILLSFKLEECFGTLIATIANGNDLTPEIELIGTKGHVIFNFEDKITFWKHSRPIPVYEKDGIDIYENQVKNFIEAINRDEDLMVTPEECKKSLSVILDVYEKEGFGNISQFKQRI